MCSRSLCRGKLVGQLDNSKIVTFFVFWSRAQFSFVAVAIPVALAVCGACHHTNTARSGTMSISKPPTVRQRSAATAATLSGWDVVAFQQKVDDEEYYEAHQIVLAAAQRHIQSGDIVMACGLLRDAVRAFLGADTNNNCQSEAADLLATAIKHLKEHLSASRNANKQATTSGSPRPRALPPSAAAAVAAAAAAGASSAQIPLSTEAANDEVRKLCDLYTAWLPRTPDFAARKLLSLRDLMALSVLINTVSERRAAAPIPATKSDDGRGGGGGVAVLPEVHREIGHACFAARDFRLAVENFAAADEPRAAALVLEAWASARRIPATELDLLVTRAVLRFLMARNTAGAQRLRLRCAESPLLGPTFKASVLFNFTQMLTTTLAGVLGHIVVANGSYIGGGGGSGDASPPTLSKGTLKKWQTFVETLFSNYAPALVNRDREFADYYFAHLRRIYFGVKLPGHLRQKASGGCVARSSVRSQEQRV